MLTAVTLIVGITVFTRYVLNNALPWGEELARYCLIWLVMIGTSLAIRYRSHLSLDTFTRRLPKHISTTIELILFVIIIVIITIITKSSFYMVFSRAMRMYSPSLGISMIWPQIILPIGFILILIQSLFIILEDIKELMTDKSP